MPLVDHTEVLNRVSRALAENFRDNRDAFNAPGRSFAFKVDYEYYLVKDPEFYGQISRLTALKPETVRESLARTGVLVTPESDRSRTSLRVKVTWPYAAKVFTIHAGFLAAGFVDKALWAFGGIPKGLYLSELGMLESERPRVDAFFQDKPDKPTSLAYIGRR